MMNVSLRTCRTAASLLLMVVLFATACAPPPETPEAIRIPTATPTTPPTETPLPTPSDTPFVPKAIIKIATQGPLSGNQAIFGTDIRRGAELAVQQLGGPLRQQGYEVRLVPYDDRNNLDSALANARQIIADPEVLCGVGHYNSRISIGIAEVYHEAGLALVAPSATAAALTERGYLEVNRIIGRNDAQGLAGAQFASAQGLASAFIITQKDEYDVRNAENFRREADRLGIQVLGMLITDVTPETLGAVVSRVTEAGPEVVYFAGTAEQAIPFFKEARAAGYPGVFLGTDDLNNPTMLDLAGPSLVEGGGMYYTIMNAPASFYPGAAQFVQDFGVYFGDAPLLFAARAYDAAGICIKAIEQASRAKGGTLPTRAEVSSAIRALRDYQGLTGTYTFNERGDPTLVEYYVYKVVAVETTNWDQNFIVASYEVATP